jgi:hypothetical protein
MLASCATPPPRPAEIPPPAEPKPPACPPALRAEVRATPAMPAGANLVEPVTMEERLAVSLYLGWVHELGEVAFENEGRSRRGKAACDGQ